MFNKIKKNSGDMRGFTLVEVMIGMMILTVAIVSATNLLTDVISSNQNNLTTLQAYYLSQEGLEMARNIRDTNWLQNRDWLGKNSEQLWGGRFETADAPNKYVVEMRDDGGLVDATKGAVTLLEIGNKSPWKIDDINGGDGMIYRHGVARADGSISSDLPILNSLPGGGEDSHFKRTIIIKKYDCAYLATLNLCPDKKEAYILVQSKVSWNLGAKLRVLTLSEVLSNWKGGAL